MIHERSLCSSKEPQKELMWALLSVSGSGQSAVERTRYKCRQGRSQGRGKKGAGNRKPVIAQENRKPGNPGRSPSWGQGTGLVLTSERKPLTHESPACHKYSKLHSKFFEIFLQFP